LNLADVGLGGKRLVDKIGSVVKGQYQAEGIAALAELLSVNT
jgi:hypothetical protein